MLVNSNTLSVMYIWVIIHFKKKKNVEAREYHVIQTETSYKISDVLKEVSF